MARMHVACGGAGAVGAHLMVVRIHMRARTWTTMARAPGTPPPSAFFPASRRICESGFCFAGLSLIGSGGASAAGDASSRMMQVSARFFPRSAAVKFQIIGQIDDSRQQLASATTPRRPC